MMRTLWASIGTDVTGVSHPKSEGFLPMCISMEEHSELQGDRVLFWKHTIVGYIHRMS